MPSFLKLNYVTRNKLVRLADANLASIIDVVSSFDDSDTKQFVEIAYNLLYNPVFKSCLLHLQPTIKLKKALIRKLSGLIKEPIRAKQLLVHHPDLVQRLSKIVIGCWGKLSIYND